MRVHPINAAVLRRFQDGGEVELTYPRWVVAHARCRAQVATPVYFCAVENNFLRRRVHTMALETLMDHPLALKQLILC